MRDAALRLIESNIAQYGYHVYIVSGGASPRYAYTIGLSDRIGSELILAGCIHYSAREAKRIIDEVAHSLQRGASPVLAIDVSPLGSFRLEKAGDSCVNLLMLGALDYYKNRGVAAYQLLPDEEHWTVDVPRLHEHWSATSDPAWKWMWEEWPYRVPRSSVAATNLSALRGGRITEAARWEEDQWELFAGPGSSVEQEHMRVVPLGVLLGVDTSLVPVTDLDIGQGLWRDESSGPWHPWHPREMTE